MGKKKELENSIDVSKIPRNKPIQFIDADTLKRITGKDMKFVNFPILLDLSDPKFQLRSLQGLDNVNAAAVRDLIVSANKLSSIADVGLFSNLQLLDAHRNLLSGFTVEHTLAKLEVIDLSHNQISEIPDLSRLPNLRELDLSQNLISGANPFAPLAGKKAKKLKWLDLGANGIDLSAFAFCNALQVLSKDNVPKLRNLDLRGNRVTKIQHYRAYAVTRFSKEITILDDKPILKTERKEKPPTPNAEGTQAADGSDLLGLAGAVSEGVGGEDAANSKEKGKEKGKEKRGITTRQTYVFQSMKGLIVRCFEHPLEAPTIMAKLETHVEGMCQQAPDLRFIDYAPLEPLDSINEFMESLTLLMQRLPLLSNIAARIMAMFISFTEDPLGEVAKNQMASLLDMQGVYDEPIWLAVRDIIVPEMTNKPMDDKQLQKNYIEIIFLVSNLETKDFHSSLAPLVPALSKALQEPEPHPQLLGILAAAARSKIITDSLFDHGVCDRIVLLFHDYSEFPRSDAFKFLVRIIQSTSVCSEQVLDLYVTKKIHSALLLLVDDMNFDKTEQWSEEDSDWAVDIISCVNTVTKNDRVFSIALQAEYVQRLLEIIDFPDVSVRLMSTCLKGLRNVLERTQHKALLEEIGNSLGFMVPLLDYIEGLSYDSVCVQSGAVKHGEPIPLSMQKNPRIHEMLVEIVGLIRFYAMRANEGGDEMAIKVNAALDSAGRERYLLALLSVPEDDVRVETVNCLAQIPLSNLDPHEVAEIVHLLAVKNIDSGRTEEVLATVLEIVTALVNDTKEQGNDFRKKQSKSIMTVLRLLERTSSRDTADSEEETKEKLQLCDACVGFLLATSTVHWAEAIEVLRSEESVKIIKNILMFEDIYGIKEHPIWIEKTAGVSTMEAGFICLEGLQVTGAVAHRVVNRMAELVEGAGRAPPPEDEDQQDAKLWKRVVADVDGSEEDRQFCLDQATFFVENNGITRLLSYLRHCGLNCDTVVDDIDPVSFQPRDVSSGVLAEVNMLEEEQKVRMKRQGALEDEDEHDVGAELDLDRLNRLEAETNLKKRKMLESATHHLQTDDDFADADIEFELPKPMGHLIPNSDMLVYEESPHAAVLAGTLRLFVAVLWYSSPEDQDAARVRLREGLTLRTLGIMARNAGWYPHNVAVLFLLVTDELFGMPARDVEEPISSLPLFDIVSQIMEVIFRLVNTRLSTGVALTPRQEMIALYACQCWGHILRQATYIPYSKLDKKINDEGLKGVYETLLPAKVLNMIIRYIYYDHQVTHSKVFAHISDNPHQLQLRDVIREQALRCVSQYITVHDQNRYAIIEHFNRLELSERLSLPAPQLQYLLDTSVDLAFHRALEIHMAEKFYMPGKPERILWQCWVTIDSSLDGSEMKRLFVVSTAAYYIFKEPFGLKCNACTPDKFCPRGPDLKARRLFSDITGVTIGYGAHSLLISHSIGAGLKMNAQFSICSGRVGVIENLVAALRQVLPTTIPIVDDRVTQGALQGALTSPSTEIILLISHMNKINIRGATQQRWFALTNAGIYNFKLSLDRWSGNITSEKDQKKYVVLRSKHDLADLERVKFSGLEMKMAFKKGKFYRVVFSDFSVMELWRRTLQAHVQAEIEVGV